MSSGESSASVYLGLGSNLGDRPRNLGSGLRGLRDAGVEVRRASSLYLTEPVGDPGDPWYVNCVVALQGPPPADELLDICLDVERRAGGRSRPRPVRRPTPSAPRPPRALDVDLLLYGDVERNEPELTVPHPRMHHRRFVLQPLAEIAPRARHPRRDRSVREMLAELDELDEPGAREGVWLLARPLPFSGGHGAEGGGPADGRDGAGR